MRSLIEAVSAAPIRRRSARRALATAVLLAAAACVAFSRGGAARDATADLAVVELRHRLASSLARNVVVVDGKRVVRRDVAGSELPAFASRCDLECRLQCLRYPPGHASSPKRKQRLVNSSSVGLRPAHFRGPRAREARAKEGAFWADRVERAGFAEYERRYGEAAAKSGEVPCEPQPYVDYAVGMREFLPNKHDRRKDAEAAALQAHLALLQRSCERAKGAEGLGRGGIGGILKFLTLGLTWAYEQNAAFVLDNPRLNPSNKSLFDLIEPFSNCTSNERWQMELTPNFRSGKYSPADYRHRGHFWWISQLGRFMLKPRPWLARRIKMERAKLTEPYIGMHVRHGDKCWGDRPDGPGTADGFDFRTLDDSKREKDLRIECPSFTEFMVHAERLRSLYGLKTIWLATDDADVVDRAMTDPCYAHWDFHFMTYDRLNPSDYFYRDKFRTAFGFEECQINLDKPPKKKNLDCARYRDRFDDTTTMLIDLAVLAEADAFVLSFTSNIGRVAYELAYAEKHCMPPVISNDIGWCFTDGQIQEGGPYGHLNC